METIKQITKMNRTLNQVQEVVSVLTANEQQLLKDTINYGSWGGDEWDFINGYGDVKTVLMHAYCTDDAIKAGHFTTREASSMWTSIYKKLCQANNNEIGQFISHCDGWLYDGSCDMLFVRATHHKVFEEWARG